MQYCHINVYKTATSWGSFFTSSTALIMMDLCPSQAPLYLSACHIRASQHAYDQSNFGLLYLSKLGGAFSEWSQEQSLSMPPDLLSCCVFMHAHTFWGFQIGIVWYDLELERYIMVQWPIVCSLHRCFWICAHTCSWEKFTPSLDVNTLFNRLSKIKHCNEIYSKAICTSIHWS